MRLGFCGSIDDAAKAAAAGFDFIEVNIQAVLRGDDDDKTWAADAPDPASFALPVEAANCLLPASHPVVGPKRDLTQLQTYMHRVTRRAAHLGIQRLVFGSGGARRAGDDVTDTQALDQIAEFCKLAGDCCAPHQVMIVIEPLNRRETNTINSVAIGAQLTTRVNHPAVRLLADSYHFGLENEPIESLAHAAPYIHHVHVAEPIGRGLPGSHGPFPAENAYDFARFFRPLRAAGYDQRVSFECKVDGPFQEKAPAAIDLIRQAWDQAATS